MARKCCRTRRVCIRGDEEVFFLGKRHSGTSVLFLSTSIVVIQNINTDDEVACTKVLYYGSTIGRPA